MTRSDHQIAAAFYRQRGRHHARNSLHLKRELRANEWFLHPDAIECLKDEITAQRMMAYEAFAQAAKDEQAAVRESRRAA